MEAAVPDPSAIRFTRWSRRAVFVRACGLLLVGLFLELALPISAAVYPGTGSVGNLCQPGASSLFGGVCAVALTAVLIWNAIGIGIILLGISSLLEWWARTPVRARRSWRSPTRRPVPLGPPRK